MSLFLVFVGVALLLVLMVVLKLDGFISLIIASIAVGLMEGMPLNEISKSIYSGIGSQLKSLILILAFGAMLGKLLAESGAAQRIADTLKVMTSGLNMNPYLLAWFVGAIIRISVGSSTVAVTMASGIVLPLLGTPGINPELMVLATSCGTVFCSHVNDPGFWMFKEYFSLSLIDTIKVRTVYSSLISTVGIIGVMVLSMFF